MTSAEATLWAAVRRKGLGVVCRRQHVIAGFIVDFYVPAASLVIEVDGGVHQEQVEYDRERDDILHAMGLKILRISNEDLKTNPGHVIVHLQNLVKQRCTSAPRSGTAEEEL